MWGEDDGLFEHLNGTKSGLVCRRASLAIANDDMMRVKKYCIPYLQ